MALALLAVADFVVVLDATIVNVALPSIGRSLHASTSELSWVVSAYILAFGGLLMLGGRLADLFGRRRLFIGGLILFGLASLAGGLSTSIGGQVRGANIAMLLMAAAMVGLFFVLTLYLQDVKGYSAIKAGLASVPLGVVLITVTGMGGPVAERIGVKPVLLSGLAIFTAGVAWMSRISVQRSPRRPPSPRPSCS